MRSRGKNSTITFLIPLTGIIILLIGLMIFGHSDLNHSGNKVNPILTETSISRDSATVSTAILGQAFIQSWIYNKDNFRLLSFEMTQFTESKKANRQIILLENIYKNKFRPADSFYKHFRLSFEKDEPPVLS